MALDEQQSKRSLAAGTAEGVAALRAASAAEPDESVRGPDYLAHRLVSLSLRPTALVKVPGVRRLVPRISEWLIPGAYCMEVARTRYLDELLLDELEAGVEEVVFLGAGYDSRPYRFADRLAGVRVLEVDHPAMSEVKRRRVRSALGELPAHVAYVEVDFTRDVLGERLAAHGHDPARPAFFVWAGVTPYLPEEAVRDVLGYVAGHTAPGTSIAFDYLFAEVLEGDTSPYGAAKLLKRVARMGEPLRFGIHRGETAAFVESCGLELENDSGPDEAVERYLTRADGRVYGQPYGFGGLAHARVRAAR